MSQRTPALIAVLLALSACTTTVPAAAPSVPHPDSATPATAPEAQTPAAPAPQAPAGIPVSGKLSLGMDVSGFQLSGTDIRTGQRVELAATGQPAPAIAADGTFSLVLPADLVGKTLRLTASSPDGKTEATALVDVVSATSFKTLQAASPLTIDVFSTLISKLAHGPLMTLQLLKPAAAAPLLAALSAELRGMATAVQGALQRDPSLASRLTANDSTDPLSDTEASNVQAAVQAIGTTSQVNQAVATLLSGVAHAYQDTANRNGAVPSTLAAQLAAVPLAGTTLSLWIDPAAGAFRMTNRQSSRAVDLTTATAADVSAGASPTAPSSSGGGGGGGSSAPAVPTFTVTDAGTPITVNFKAKVGSEDLVCTATAAVGSTPTYAHVGQDDQTIRPLDFRYYVHDLKLVKADGSAVATALTANDWQYQNLVLIDQETVTTAATNTQVSFTAPTGTYTGIRFTLGVPHELNHLAMAAGSAAHAILQSDDHGTGMAWAWLSGRKYTKIEFAVPQPDTTERSFLIHLGGQGASNPKTTSDPDFDPLATTLSSPNLTTVTLDGFNPASNAVIADLKDFLTNINVVEGGSYMPAPMSASGGNATDVVLKNFGLAGGSSQKLFKKGT